MTPQGLLWLTIPVHTKGRFYQKISEARVMGHDWIDKHWKSIQMNYARAQYFDYYKERIRAVYENCRKEEFLSQINYRFLMEICDILDIHTKISWSSDYHLTDGKTERLVNLVKEAGGGLYLSGPAAKDYIVEECFQREHIELAWMDYSGYPEYTQLSSKFEHGVSILDLIFNEGPNAQKYMKVWR